jgi:hypothetical protein
MVVVWALVFYGICTFFDRICYHLPLLQRHAEGLLDVFMCTFASIDVHFLGRILLRVVGRHVPFLVLLLLLLALLLLLLLLLLLVVVVVAAAATAGARSTVCVYMYM